MPLSQPIARLPQGPEPGSGVAEAVGPVLRPRLLRRCLGEQCLTHQPPSVDSRRQADSLGLCVPALPPWPVLRTESEVPGLGINYVTIQTKAR